MPAITKHSKSEIKIQQSLVLRLQHISNTRQYNIIGKMGRSSTTFAIFTLLLRNDNHQFVFDKIHPENTVKSIKTVIYRVYIFQCRQSSTQNWPQSAGTAPNGCIFRVQWFFSVYTISTTLMLDIFGIYIFKAKMR